MRICVTHLWAGPVAAVARQPPALLHKRAVQAHHCPEVVGLGAQLQSGAMPSNTRFATSQAQVLRSGPRLQQPSLQPNVCRTALLTRSLWKA